MSFRLLLTSLFCCLLAGIAAAQGGSGPVVYSGGTVSAASLFPQGAPNYGAAPGSIVSIFGTNLADSAAQATSIPLPTTLKGTSVTIAGIAAPLFYVGAGQINAQVPYSAPIGTQQVIVKTVAGASTPEAVLIHATQPALFSINQNGMGQAAVQNVIVNGSSVSYVNNSATVAVSPGNLLVAYGTGGGSLGANGPGTGEACTSQQLFPTTYSATVGDVATSIQYAGCAPGFVGLDQWNITIPATIPDGCYLPLQVFVNGVPSNVVTAAVSKTGNCSSAATGVPAFPAGESYSTLLLGRTVAVAPDLPGTVTTSQFYGFFNQLAAASTPSAGGYPPAGGGCLTEIHGSGSPPVGFSSYSNATALDAGTLTITSSSGATTTPAAATTGNYEVSASLTNNGLTITPGAWTVTGSGGNNVGAFTASAIASPLLTNVNLGVSSGSFSASLPLTTAWTCPDPTAEVVVSISSTSAGGSTSATLYGGAVCTAACSSGTLTVPSSVLSQLPLSGSGNASIFLILYPAVANAKKFSAPGLTQGYFFFFDSAAAPNLTLTR